MTKVLLTGGHAGTAALATINYIKRNKDWDVSWIGTHRAIEGTNILTLESKIFKNLNIEYYEIDSGRFQKKFTKHTLPSILRIPKAFIASYFLLNKIKPEIVLSFGGFVSVPVVISAWLQGIPVVIHEQTIAIGLANKISSYFAEKIAVSRTETKHYVNKSKCVHTGNPIMDNIVSLKRRSNNNTIYITGGSRGSQKINKVVFDSINELSKKYKIIHQTGELDFTLAKEFESSNYAPIDFIRPEKVHEIYEKAGLVISRAGANTVAEIIYHKIPSILIPIAWTRYDEQRKNANLAQKYGIAEIIDENNLDSKLLIKYINKQINKKIKTKKLKTLSKDINAAENLVNLLESII